MKTEIPGFFVPWPFPSLTIRFSTWKTLPASTKTKGENESETVDIWNPKRTESEKIQSVQKVAVYLKKMVIKMSPICLSLIQVLSFHILPFPTPVFCPEMIFSTRVSFDPEMSLVKVWDAICMGKRSGHILHINWFWLVNCETNKRLGPGYSWPFEMVKTWPFLEGCSCPPTIGDQKVTVWNRIASYYQPQNNARFLMQSTQRYHLQW